MELTTPACTALRHDWTVAEIEAIYSAPLPDLIFRAQTVHRAYHRPGEVQGCSLLSIKTGGCPEDCAYCPQSAHYKTGVEREGLLSVDERWRLRATPKRRAQRASAWARRGATSLRASSSNGCSTWCAACARLGMEACCTLGMLTDEQAQALAEAGLTAYNHNLDTSAEFYGEIISTRTYEDRLTTLERVRRVRRDGVLRRHHRHGREPRRNATGCCASYRRSIRIRKVCR